MKAKEITYERVKSYDYNNVKVGIVINLEENDSPESVMEKAKEFVAKQLGEEVKESYNVSARCKNCGKIFGAYGSETLKIPYKQAMERYPCTECASDRLERDQ